MTQRVLATYAPDSHIPSAPWDEHTQGVHITNVRCIVTAPEHVNLVVVIVETSEPGLVGYGCATFTQRALAVQSVVEHYLRPLVIGRSIDDISDIHAVLSLDSYWRSGPVLNNAISGIDMALWDLKGKAANLPTWQLLGGRVREVVPCYVHATGTRVPELHDQVQRQIDRGYRHVRCQVSVPGSMSYGAAPESRDLRWSQEDYLAHVPDVLLGVRELVGDRVQILHDVHERLSPGLAVRLVERLDPIGLFYVEDPLAPEDLGWLPRLRERTSSRIAMGELFTRVEDYLPLIQDRLVDVLRCHMSALGGLTPAARLSHVAESYGVQIAWHGPRDVSPIGHAANFALEISSPAFGIREHHEFTDAASEVFPGTLVADEGSVRPSTRPGLGVGFDEAAAAKHPPVPPTANWHYARVRRTDGTVQRP
jgi:mannonate dehydratase